MRAPSVPTGTLPDDVAGVIQESGVSGAKLATQVLALLRRLFGVDNVIEAKVTVTSTPGAVAYVELTDHRTGETLTVQKVERVGSAILLRQVAAVIKNEALSRRSQLPPWQEWSADALAVFLAAIDLEDETTASASLEAAGVSS